VVDANGNPIMIKMTEGTAHAGRCAADSLATTAESGILLADHGYYGDGRYRNPGCLDQHQANATPGEHHNLWLMA
jgi:hypothetical protein